MFGILGFALRTYNAAHRFFWPYSPPPPDCEELKEIENRAAAVGSDISDHLATIFCETLTARPRLIVELGVREGESRFVLERVARSAGSFLLSIDINDCASACNQSVSMQFIQADDVQFAGQFQDWCSQRGIEPWIDVLFIDTSHLYEHTLREIRAWFPHLTPKCTVIFHDTNLRRFIRRRDGTIGGAWNNDRGVIRAIEDHLGVRFSERADFVTIVQDWLVHHWAHCNGLTILERQTESMIRGNRTAQSLQPASRTQLGTANGNTEL